MRGGNPDTAGLDRFFADAGAAIEQGEVPCAAFADPAVYRRELESVFGACWVFVALESEVPNAGDFVLRTVGEDEVIVVRDDDARVHVLRNACRHRGAPVCRTQRGNARQFYCPYHGWTYRRNGEWAGAPFKDRAYKDLDRERWGLLRAARVDSYRGLIFACLDPDAPTLAEYLGGMRWYLDLCLGLQPRGMQPVGGPHRWRVRSNWKTAAENFLSDAYHVVSLHRSVEEVGIIPKDRRSAGTQFHAYLPEGHGALLSPRPLPEPWGILGYPPAVEKTFELGGLSTSQRAFLDGYAVTTFTIFPNLSFIRVPGRPDRESAPVVHTALRQWQPRGEGEVEVWHWCLVWPGAPEWFNEQSCRVGIALFGPGGLFEQDDSTVWRGAHQVGASVFGGGPGSTFNYQLGLDGMSDYHERDDWLGPGRVSDSIFGEQPQRAFYQRWLRELRAGGVRAGGAE